MKNTQSLPNEEAKHGKLLSTSTLTNSNQKSPPVSTRIAWIDAARGLLIVLVVVGHAIIGIVDAGLTNKDGLLAELNKYIYTFHMPAFFFLSGLLAWSSVNKNQKRFFHNILIRIAYPYFLWGTIQLLIMNLFSNFLNNPTPFDPLEFLNLVLRSPSPFWFLKVLFLIHVVYLVFMRYSNAYWFLLMSIVMPSVARVFPLNADMSHFVTSTIFYGFGVMFAKETISLPTNGRFPLIWTGVIGLLWLFSAGIVQGLYIPALAGQKFGGFPPASIAGSFFVFTLASLKYIENWKLLIYLGQHTLAIFCLHVLFVAGTRIVVAKLLGVTSVAVIFPAAVLAGLAGPLAVAATAERFRLRRVLGLG